MKQLKLIAIALVFSNFSFAQKDIAGTVKTEVVKKKSIQYALHIPENSKDKKPLIVFLHGAGERGTDIDKVKVHGPFKYLQTNVLDAYILAPQCAENEYWDTDALYELVLKIQKEHNIDDSRIYLTGLSMGAWGAWNLATAHPEKFAALVTIAGAVDRVVLLENKKLASMPIKIFHGLLDDVVDMNYSVMMYKRLKASNGNVTLTIFDDANHDSWSRLYDNKEIYEWMFKQTKNK
ncbi:prolyl oligopeptidase family serine peptidase [Flavobacterium frigidarium]|uniref:carboxylesterase family protein n=1 Tax=Flavobacterium frigidarium TaxID=99286 RepID=UPI0030D951B4|tara:strand:- start:1674 stop:2378 length:705 start_codon:yes stop_codon:yes gene_type:complete